MSAFESQAQALLKVAGSLVEQARRLGADVAEASASTSWELSAKVRLGKPELLQEAGQRGVSLRVIRGGRVAVTATSDWSPEGLERCVADALELAQLSQPDDCAGPADPSLLARGPLEDLDLFDAAVDALTAEDALSRCEELERLALACDSRLTLSEGASFSRASAESALVLSSGFTDVRRSSYVSLSMVPVAEDEGGKKRRGSYWTGHRFLSGLEPLQQVAERAAERTLRQLGARKVATGQAPIVFDAEESRSLVSALIGCAMGGSIWRKSSYLVGREGTQVGSPLITIVDDPLIRRGVGSRAVDGEGVPCRRQVVVQAGQLQTYLLDSYSARKLGRQTTGNASRSGGSIGVSTSNLIMQPGTMSRAELIASTPRGLLVTDTMGFGFNAITGDYSRGASGFWIEDGKLAFPVSEVTISGNLDEMLKSVDAVASDLELKTSCAAPSFRIAQMTIAGE